MCPDRPLRLKTQMLSCGVVGVANFGARRREAIRRHGGFRIAGIFDADHARAEAAALEEGCRIYESVKEMAEDAEIEVGFICSPPQFHVAQAWEFARRRKAIFTEKPLGPDLSACRELVEYCEREKVPHGHGFSMREGPLRTVRSLLGEGVIGKVVSVSAWVMHSGGWVNGQDDWRSDRILNPGGPLFQLGTHYLDAFRFLFGDGKWLAAESSSRFTQTEVDDAFVALGSFGNIPCTLHTHYVCAERCGMEIFGTEGTLIWEANLPRLRFRRMIPKTKEIEEDWTGRLPPTSEKSFLMEDFYRAILDQCQPECSGRDALAVIELVDQAVRLADLSASGEIISSFSPALPRQIPILTGT